MADVAFKEGTASAYSKITPDSHTFYHTTDDDQVYLGSIPLSDVNTLVKKSAWRTISNAAVAVSGGVTYTSTYTFTSTQSVYAHLLGFITNIDGIGVSDWSIKRGTTQVTVTVEVQCVDPTTSQTNADSMTLYRIYYNL